MGSTRFSLKRTLLLSGVLAISLLSGEAFAQGTSTNTQAQPTNTNTQRTSPSPPAPAPPSSTNTRPTTAQAPNGPASLPPLGQPTTQTTTTSQRPAGGLPGLPTLSKTLNTEIGTFPPPTVPPTANAPFMNHSTLPDGTVFIAVGAILGAFGVAIVAWRGIVACLLHRSVERAALAQHVANDKASTFPAPPAQFYKFLERDPSPVSGAAAALGGALGGRSRKSHVPSVASASQTNLFFSPTAAPGGAGLGSTGNRDSRFLPSGFYAAASPIPGHNAGTSISMSTLRPSSRGRPGVGPSPPGSPGFGPRRNMSSTSVDRPASSGNGRAPSAFLDDLLDDQQGGPHPPMPHQNRYPSGPDGQYYTQSPSPPGHRGY